MQTEKCPRENVNAKSSRFNKRIGSTLYEVNIYFGKAETESLEDKILRLVENESLKNLRPYINMETLRTERLPERGFI